MEQYIPKSVLVAEIKKLYNGEIDTYTRNILDRLKSNIDTLEVKEVNLQEEIEFEYNPMDGLSFEEFARIAKHFFELGVAANNKSVKEVDLDKQAEWIANGIMIAVQSAKLHTNVYNPDRKDYDHSHLMQAARRGIELG